MSSHGTSPNSNSISSRREAVQKEISRVQQALAEAMVGIDQAENDLETVNASIASEQARKSNLLSRLDELEREAPRTKEKQEESSNRLRDLKRRYDEEVQALSQGNSEIRVQKKGFIVAMDTMQQPLIEALNMRFAGRIRRNQHESK